MKNKQKQLKIKEKKKVEALKYLKLKEQTKSTEDKHHDNLSMQEKSINRLLDGRMDWIREMSKEINYNSLTYLYITTGIRQTSFIEFIGPLHIFKEIKNGDKTIQLTVEKKKN